MNFRWRALGKGFLAILFLCHGILSHAAVEPSVAMILDLEGKATIFEHEGGSRASILSEIRPDTRVQVEAGSRMVAVYLGSGQSFEIKGPAVVVFRRQQPESQSGARPESLGSALSKGNKEVRIKPVSVAQAAVVLRSIKVIDSKLTLVSPVGNLTLEERPMFRWKELAPNIQYRFAMVDEAGKALYQTDVNDTSLRLSFQVQMKEGVKYRWMVTAQHPEGAVFTNSRELSLASPELQRQVQALLPTPESSLAELVAFAAWLEQSGLRDEARTVWKAVAAERLADPRVRALAAD